MTTTPRRSSFEKSPSRSLWKALIPMKTTSNRRKMQKSVSFSDQLLVVPTAVCLSPGDEDTLWWTEDELEIIVTTARVKGELDVYREGIMKAQFQIREVLKEQDRLRRSGQLGSDWKPIARVSRKGSTNASRQARKNGIEFENHMLQDCGKNLKPQPAAAKCGSRCTDCARLVRSKWLRIRPLLESNRQ
ncbi:unnamed protein product [Cylindrotheca closterium]|uniref:Uncharacterized protein n=1 Tax=Cylindrotheca closterium TaxID=2856 RepID=A0AAD2G436_9STRA|nr:unnamed protein product [Cylindrotheca closterium]